MANTASPTQTAGLSKKQFAYDRIKHMIINGRFAPHEALVERQLCQEIGVSRTPVREALQMLVNDGMLQNVDGKGIFLRQVNLRDLIELFELRLALESLAVSLFVERATDADIAQLRNIFDYAEHALAADDHQTFMKYDMDFHNFIAAGSRNHQLYETIESNYDRIRMMAVSVQDDPVLCRMASENHAEVMHAIEQRDRDAAVKAMIAHVNDVKNYHQSRFYLYQ